MIDVELSPSDGTWVPYKVTGAYISVSVKPNRGVRTDNSAVGLDGKVVGLILITTIQLSSRWRLARSEVEAVQNCPFTWIPVKLDGTQSESRPPRDEEKQNTPEQPEEIWSTFLPQ